MQSDNLKVRDIRSLPFFWVHRTFLDVIRPSWRGLVTYNALAYFAVDSSVCKGVGMRALADKVGVSEDTIARGLEELESKKAIQVKSHFRRKNGKRFKLPNEYTLVDLAVEKKQPI